jgi:uncharacterized protein (DUF885 family)
VPRLLPTELAEVGLSEFRLAMSYHEANPGHHFQLSIEQEFAERSPLRRFGGILAGTAFAEGWGLYC